jgi:uncharacterized membrane protein YhaH (DUF805 family)
VRGERKYDYPIESQGLKYHPLSLFNFITHFTKGNAMNMGQAISTCFSKYADFSGRATRSEYWYFYLFYVIVLVAVTLIDPTSNGLLTNLVPLPFIIPLLSAAVRRMHDVGKSGWFLLIPVYGFILAVTGSTGDNQYGPASA